MAEVRQLHLRGALGAARVEQYQGREHLIVPVVALMDGVIHAVNASTPERVTAATLTKAAHSWNGRPLVLGHPMKNGRQCSANEPAIEASHRFGTIFNSRMSGAKLLMDAYVDPVAAERLGGADFVQNLRDGRQCEVSVGAYVMTDNEAGVHMGKPYKATWLETVGDHLAFLPGGRGACSIEMGCGAHRAAMHLVTAEEIKMLDSPRRSLKERILALFNASETFQDFEQGLEALGSSSSGNFGHSGRPGQVGGSGGKGGKGGGGGNRYKDVDGSKAAATAAALAASEKAMKSGKAEDHEAAAEAHGKAVSKYPSAGYSAVGKFDSTKDDVMFGTHDELQQLHKEAAGDPDYQDLIVESGDDLPSALENIKEYNSPEAAKRWADADQEHHDEMIKQGFVQDESGEYVEANPKPRGKNDPIAKWEANHPGQKWKAGKMGDQLDAGPIGRQGFLPTDDGGRSKPFTRKDELNELERDRKATKSKGKKLKGASSKDCSVCDGTGQVKNEKQQQEDCPSCEGVGKITAAETNDGTAVEEVQMKKVDAIKALTACPCSGFTAADAKELEAFSEERLTTMAEAATARKAAEDKAAADLKAAQDGATKAAADVAALKAAAEKQPTEEEYLAKAPVSIRTLVENQKRLDAAEKTAIVTQLKAASKVLTEEQLNAKSLEELRVLASFAKVEIPAPADYSGRPMPRTAAASTDDYTPPDPYEAGIKALQGSKTVN
ncbi:MAG: DUF2213 domain-containing protein [Nitrospirales bacterium]|jgi:hypothetical protein